MFDIYFDENYGKLYEKIENGTSIVFKHESELGKIQHQFIKREIPIHTNNDTYFDIVSPYGYGGPIIIETSDRDALVAEFEKKFKEYCQEKNIVSEFIRFHPVIQNNKDFETIYDVDGIRNTVGTNLKDFDDPFQAEFSRSCRKNVRRALRNDVSFKITEKPDDIKSFLEIYYSTMDRNSAQNYYYFDEEYFNKNLEYFKDNLLIVEAIYEEKTIAMGFYYIYNEYIHTHLSGTLSEYLKLSPAYVLRYALTQWGKEQGYHLIHHGGGTTNDPEDSLFKFKKQFGNNTEFEFHIGKKVWNEEIYDSLCSENNIDKNIEFFPAYRYNGE